MPFNIYYYNYNYGNHYHPLIIHLSHLSNKVGRNHRAPAPVDCHNTSPAMSSQPGGRYGTQLPQRSSTHPSPSELHRSPSTTSITSNAHLDSRSMPGHSSSLADHSQLSPSSSLAAPAQFNRYAYSQEQQRSTSSHSDDTHTRSNHNQYSSHQYQQQQQQQQQSPVPLAVCAKCSNNVTGQFVRALGVVFHKDCFRCKV